MNWYTCLYIKLASCDSSIVYHATAGDDSYGWEQRIDYLAFTSPAQAADPNAAGSPYRITLLEVKFNEGNQKAKKMRPLMHSYISNCEDEEEIIDAASYMSGLPKDRWHASNTQEMKNEIGVAM